MVTIGLVPLPNVAVPSYSVPENAGTIPVCVEVVSGTVGTGLSVPVAFDTASNSATCKSNVNFRCKRVIYKPLQFQLLLTSLLHPCP